METLHDISVKQKVEWLQAAMAKHSHLHMGRLFLNAIRRVRSQGKRPRYPTFFNLQPLVDFAFAKAPSPPDRALQLDRLLVQLRITTLMRSHDVEQVVWALFSYEGKYYIHTTSKSGLLSTFRVSGMTLCNLVDYLHRHLDFPALNLIRYLKEPSRCLGAERIAKRVLERMAELGVDTAAFKAHSLRGAAATRFLGQGVPPQWVQARGGWSSEATMQQYYSRLHQDQDWEAALQGEIVGIKHSANCSVLAPILPLAGSTEEDRSGGREETSTEQVAELSAHGVLRDLFAEEVCPSCGGKVAREAGYRCRKCQSLFHVRCLAVRRGTPAQQCTLTVCFVCDLTMERQRGEQGLIVDVMGVCE